MSHKIRNRAWSHSNLSGANKLLLLALAEQADDDGFTWVSYKTLAPMVGVQDRQVYRLVDNLIEKGELIVWDQQGQWGGRGYTNIYFVTTGLSKAQIAEVVRIRFELVGEEIEAVLNQKGDTYVRLCDRKRIAPATLERTKKRGGYVTLKDEQLNQKGDTYDSPDQDKGDTYDTQNEGQMLAEPEKGDTSVTRLLDSLNQESIKDNQVDISPSGEPANTALPPEPVPRKRTRIPSTPAFKAYTDITDYWKVTKYWRDKMAEIVGDSPESLKRWGDTVRAYTGLGWFAGNVKTMLEEYYLKGRIPGKDRQNGAYQNGTYQRPNQKSTGATGESLEGTETFDPNTGETVLPDGTRIPAT